MFRPASLVFMCVVFVASIAAAQTYQGIVRGQVRDQNGVVPAVEITLTNEETRVTRTTVTNEVGEYAFANVLPATFSVKASLTGFRTEERTRVRVGAQQAVVEDFQLQVGAVAEEITVTGQAPLLERATGSVGTSLDSKTLETLPVFGRNAFYTSIFTANVIQSGDPQFVRYQDQTNASYLSLGGGPRRGNGYLLEGVSTTDFTNRPTIVPSIEAIEEVKVQVKTYDADMGHAAGGVFNTVGKSGGNTFHGSGLLIAKPGWATGELYFAKKAGVPKPAQYYYDGGGSVGGPIVKDKTFFWFSTEEYQDQTTRNQVLRLPTATQRNGDFSGLVNAQGQPIVIYDPLTTRPDPARPGQYIRSPFPGNVIPASRIDPVARAALQGLPLPSASGSFNGNATLVDGPQNQETIKIDQHWRNAWTTTGMYAHQHTSESGSALLGDFGTIAGDPGASMLLRTIDFAALNNLFVPNNTTVIAVRYGYNRFAEGVSFPSFDAASLGFPPSYTSALTLNTFPAFLIGGYGLNATSPTSATIGNSASTSNLYISQSLNASVSKVVGHHTFKFGADYRLFSTDTLAYGPSAGSFTFSPGFTQGPNPNSGSSAAGDAFASFLLGYPSSGTLQVATQGNYYNTYYGVYAQDDNRISGRLTLNYGLRYEFESGLQEQNNRFAVGFDRSAPFPVQVPGLDLKGGLAYAGQNGYPTEQGHPLHSQFAPRAGFSYSIDDRTVVRGGWGLFWAPTQYAALTEAALGARGYSAATSYFASNDGGLTPAGHLANPFPSGITPPQGNSQGLLTGAGGQVDFVDQDSKPGYVQQYSIDVQRELRGGNVVSIGYQGSRSERLSIGGTQDATININQLDPKYFSLGPQLQQLVANPFYGQPVFGNLSVSPTIAYGQLLRPFPQFGDVLAHRVNGASARYNALVLRWDKRLERGWGGGVNYTYSRLTDNQLGEANFYSNRLGGAENNYDLGAEYGVSLLDVPHRLNANVTFDLPFGAGRRWLSSADGLTNALLGGWSVSVGGRYQSGFPISIWQASNNSGLFGSSQRPNIVPGVDPASSGSTTDRLGQWFNPAAWTAAPAFTFGDAPRTDTRVRTPRQQETDLSIQKSFRSSAPTVSVRADVLNLFDNPLFLGPVTQFGSPTFGQVQSVGGFARSLQLQLRVNW